MDNQKSIIASISISGEITLNLHSLNNEGGEGNQIITRQLTIVDKTGTEHTVNGISGDMLKHIHAAHLVNLATEDDLPLSNLAKLADPNRIGADQLNLEFPGKENKDVKQSDVIDAMLRICTLTDIHGVLMVDDVKGKKNTPRKSVIEFGWTVGIPGKTNTESYFHTKIRPNENPVPFNRPANHGVYAVVCSSDIYRIGFNDLTRTYPIDDPARKKRFQALIKSLIATFINPKGAMTSIQKPHITDFKGVVAISRQLLPAPTVSALNENYSAEIRTIANNLNELVGDKNASINETATPKAVVGEPLEGISVAEKVVEVENFDGLGELTTILKKHFNAVPYKISS